MTTEHPSEMRHLHQDDFALAVPILLALLSHRSPDERIPFSRTESGVEVDWEVLENGPLSTTERMTVRLAHVIADFEHHGGGFPGSGTVGDSVVEAVRILRAS